MFVGARKNEQGDGKDMAGGSEEKLESCFGFL